MQNQNQNEACPSGQNAAGSAPVLSDSVKIGVAKRLQDLRRNRVRETEKRLEEIARTDQIWRSVPAKIDVPCEFHIFLPKVGTKINPMKGALRTLIWDPYADRPLGREPFTMPQFQVGGPIQLLNVEGRKTLLIVGEVEEVKLETPEEPLDWMTEKGLTEFQSICGRGFMTFDPRDCFLDGVSHAFGRMILEPNLPISGFSLWASLAVGDLSLWRKALVTLSMKAGPRQNGERKNLEALARAGMVQKYHMGLATVFSAEPMRIGGRMGDRSRRPGLVAVFPGHL